MDGCEGKKRFVYYKRAREVNRQVNRRHDKAHTVVYKCKYCKGWHIGNDTTKYKGVKKYERKKFTNRYR